MFRLVEMLCTSSLLMFRSSSTVYSIFDATSHCDIQLDCHDSNVRVYNALATAVNAIRFMLLCYQQLCSALSSQQSMSSAGSLTLRPMNKRGELSINIVMNVNIMFLFRFFMEYTICTAPHDGIVSTSYIAT